MATKRFIIEVEEGDTKVSGKCSWDCPFAAEDYGILYCNALDTHFNIINCDKYNLTTMKIKEMEEQQ